MPLAFGDLYTDFGGHGFQIWGDLVVPKSRGSVKICDTDIKVNPKFRFNFLRDNDDLLALRSGYEILKDLSNQKAFAEFMGKEINPGPRITSTGDIKHVSRKPPKINEKWSPEAFKTEHRKNDSNKHRKITNMVENGSPKGALWATKRRPTNQGLPPCCAQGAKMTPRPPPRAPRTLPSLVFGGFLVNLGRIFHFCFYKFLNRFLSFFFCFC